MVRGTIFSVKRAVPCTGRDGGDWVGVGWGGGSAPGATCDGCYLAAHTGQSKFANVVLQCSPKRSFTQSAAFLDQN